MQLSIYEKEAIAEYLSATKPHRTPKDTIRDCRQSVIHILQNVCLREYRLDENSADFKQPVKYLSDNNFFGAYDTHTKKWVPHNQLKGRVSKKVFEISDERNKRDYKPNDPSRLITDENDLAKSCTSSLKEILKWYFNYYNKYNLYSIVNLPQSDKLKIADLFVAVVTRAERIVARDNHYVILLIDSSQSMVWPYLEDPENSNKEDCKDYKNAVTRLKSAIQAAHEKALSAFRASPICADGYLYLYQHTFNHERKQLNEPEALSQDGSDKVVKMNPTNYQPKGMTALYNAIDDTLKVIYDKFLVRSFNEEKRIDKVSIAVITDGEDTITDGIENSQNPLLYQRNKQEKIRSINNTMRKLRGDGNPSQCYLMGSVLLGLTGNEFTESRLKDIMKELSFDQCLSINQADEQSLGKAFKLFSTGALNA